MRLLTYRLLYDDGSRASKTNGVAKLTQQPFVEVNSEDAKSSGIADGQEVTVTTAHGSLTLTARVTDGIAQGVVFVPTNQPGANALTLVSWDERHPTVELKAT